MTVAERAAGLTSSPIRSIARGAPPGTISLALGEPGWPVPDAAVQALAGWSATAMTCSYGPNEGLPELVDALSRRYGVPPVQVMVTAGSQAALFALFQAHVTAGSRVLVPDPGFPAYRTLATLAAARSTTYPVAADGSLDPDTLIELLDRHKDVSLVVLNHPGNPTGGVAGVSELAQVARACERRGVPLVSDEVYRELHLHPGTPPPSLREVSNTAIVVESVSKAWAAPGLRVGWATGPEQLLAPARLVHNAMNTAPARPSQVAATALLEDSATVLADSRRELRRRWDLVAAGPPVLRPARPVVAGFYRWLPLPPWAVADPEGFVRRVRDEGRVLVVPGTAFGPAGSGYVRVSVGGPRAELVQGLARLAPWWEEPC